MKSLKPFFCYYGGKWRSAPRYPAPRHDLIIEPFAGAAGYATRYHKHQIKLYDADPVICGVWDFLIHASPFEIMNLPCDINNVQDLKVPAEAKWLIGFWLNKGTSQPRLTPSSWMRSGIRPDSYWGEAIRSRIATQVSDIRHWTVENRSYEETDNEKGCWFVDPPYQGKPGKNYRFREINYQDLGKWCIERSGQAIVCEMEGSEWLPFRTLGTFKSNPSARGKSYCGETLWTKEDP